MAASTVAWPVCPSATSSPVALDPVLVAEPRALDVGAAGPDGQPVVEVRGAVVAQGDLGRERLDPALLDRLVAARVHVEPGDPRDLEPDEERGMVGDPLRVGLRKADLDVGRERETVHLDKPTMAGVSAAQLAELIGERQPCVVLSGAGMSTESGIPDFRSAAGIWAQYDPMEVATIDAFRRDPARVWEFYARRARRLGEVEPNDGHRAVAELERRGLVRAVVTQNVDGLHQRAGSREVVEVHGSLDHAVCPACGPVSRSTRCCASSQDAAGAGLPAVRRRAQAGCRHVRGAAAASGDRRGRPSSRAARRSWSSSDRRSRSGRLPDCRSRRGRSRSSTAARRRSTSVRC